MFLVTSKPVQEEKHFRPEPEQKTARPKATTSAPFKSSGNNNRRFGASKSNFAKPIIQEEKAQNIEEPQPVRSSFRRPSRFAQKTN